MRPTTPTPAPLPAAHLHILLALLEGELHGYAIMQAVERLTAGAARMGPGTLYGALKRLLETGLVEESGERSGTSDDERRRYYRLAGAGRQVVLAETARLRRLVDFAHEHLRQAGSPA